MSKFYRTAIDFLHHSVAAAGRGAEGLRSFPDVEMIGEELARA